MIFTWDVGLCNDAIGLATQAAIINLFCSIFVVDISKPVEPDRLFDGLPNSLRPSSGSPGNQADSSIKALSNNHSEHQNSNLETAVYTPPTLIPPRVLPLLHDLAQQMVQAGHQQQLLKIYRYSDPFCCRVIWYWLTSCNLHAICGSRSIILSFDMVLRLHKVVSSLWFVG